MRIGRLAKDRGSVLIEVVAFAVVGFGLVLTLGLQLLEQERKALELQGIARNSMRAYLLSSSNSIDEEVLRHQESSRLWSEESISLSLKCNPSDCSKPNALVWLEVTGADLDAKAFGVRSD